MCIEQTIPSGSLPVRRRRGAKLIASPAAPATPAPAAGSAEASQRRSGAANLNSAISGNSGHEAGPMKAWREGVFDGQEVSAAHPATSRYARVPLPVGGVRPNAQTSSSTLNFNSLRWVLYLGLETALLGRTTNAGKAADPEDEYFCSGRRGGVGASAGICTLFKRGANE